MCGMYMYIRLPYMAIKYLEYMANKFNFVGIFVSGTYVAVRCEVVVVVGCVLAYLC